MLPSGNIEGRSTVHYRIEQLLRRLLTLLASVKRLRRGRAWLSTPPSSASSRPPWPSRSLSWAQASLSPSTTSPIASRHHTPAAWLERAPADCSRSPAFLLLEGEYGPGDRAPARRACPAGRRGALHRRGGHAPAAPLSERGRSCNSR